MSEGTKKAGKQAKRPQDVVAIVNDILNNAVVCRASDIHFEPAASELLVKFRLDGVLDVVEKLPKVLAENVTARLKVLGGLLTYRNDIPQEGRIELQTAKDNILDVRLAVFPTINGQRAIVRILYQHAELTELEQLGFTERNLEILKEIAEANQGLLLLTGPAGSGKSTTLAAILRYILKTSPGKSIVSLEDPVEIRVEGVTQVQITPYGEMNFPTALRSLLRQDPQVLMIGEIRDAETARIAVEAGLTGHFLMSTMHSGTPAAGFVRLLEMGIEPYQVTSSIAAVLNQRLVRKLCTQCRKRNNSTGLYEAVGCDNCFNTGFRGRALISEIACMSSPLRKAILSKNDIEQLDEIIDESRKGANIISDGMRLVEKGITTRAELKKVCPSVEGEFF